MTLEEIKELIHLVQQSGVAELEVQRGDNRVRIKRSNNAVPQEIVIAPAAAPPVLTAAQTPAAVASPGAIPAVSLNSVPQAAVDTPEAEPELSYVKSPIVGTFYESASPGSPSFIKVGDHVSPGQVLCIIESMKLMNEIESEVSGTIARKLVENGKPVEYGQALFAVRPD
jgi:acetyl-CoA carboxylase biotin carboxyl carrier protein